MIDGIDEVNQGRHDLLDAIHHVFESSSSVLKVFISSREDASIARSLDDAISVHVSSADNSSDVAVLVNRKVVSAIEKKRLLGGQVSQSLRHNIISSLLDGAGEMFLWASLQLQHLCDDRAFKTEADLVTALGELPPTLEITFDNIYQGLAELKGQAKNIARQVISYSLAARRPVYAHHLVTLMTRRSNCVDGNREVLEKRDSISTRLQY